MSATLCHPSCARGFTKTLDENVGIGDKVTENKVKCIFGDELALRRSRRQRISCEWRRMVWTTKFDASLRSANFS